MGKYQVERIGQIDFYNSFLPRVNPDLNIKDIISDNSDGVLNGNILEFKTNVSDLNSALFQCIKYLSAIRIKGKPVPSGIVIIDLNAAIAWYFYSNNYLRYIEKPYYGAASKNNTGFICGYASKTLHYKENIIDAEELVSILKTKKYIKIHIDENCIVGWAKTFYNLLPTARKEDFIGDDTGVHNTIGEIRNPRMLKEYIYPYIGETNIKFNYLMDRLNDTLQKKNLGAFYTPELYAEKSIDLLRKAISRVPNGNDYIILDRCAGTGNLEIKLSDEELSHCIVSTAEYYEYKVLQELLGSKVRHIIPPYETTDTFNAGLVNGSDALSKDYIDCPIIKKYIDDTYCTIILFENPPYAETTSIEWHKKNASKKSSLWKNSYVVKNMKQFVKGAASNDLGNAFIWSAFKYYLRQPTDSYVVYSPVKYWKVQNLISKKFLDGYAFNRKHFHTNINATIMCALWSNEDESQCETIELKGFDIDTKYNKLQNTPCILQVKKIHSIYSQKYYDNTQYISDTNDGILVNLDGLEASSKLKHRIVPRYSDDIIGYLVADSSGFDAPDTHSSLLIAGRYNGNGFYLRKHNYLEKLPMFAASRYITYNREWTERARVMKSADGSERFFKDIQNGKLYQFLLKCLLFSCVERQNHMCTFVGSDGRLYKNELCLDNTNGVTIASQDLKNLTKSSAETKIINQWELIFNYAKKTEKYKNNITYGIYQISQELDTYHTDVTRNKRIWDNIELHSSLITLKTLVKEYYITEIVPILFDYEFLK